MSKRLYPHNRVRYWYAYDIDDVCTLFSDRKLHPQTVRKWVKRGLPVIDKSKPLLIYGYDLIAYLKKQNRKNKCSTNFDQLFCMKCQDARYVLQSKIAIENTSKGLKVSGRCRECKTLMYQNYKMNDLSRLRRTFRVVTFLELCDNAAPAVKTHIAAQDEKAASESRQGSLF